MDDSRQKVRRGRKGEAGQSLVLFLMIFTTFVLLAVVAVAVGQVMVRRYQAQMVVDAAAFAGASRQAEGLNTIANLNKRELDFLNAIAYSKIAPYMDSDNTTTERLVFAADDWVGDIMEGYQDVFDVYNDLIDLVNCLYSIPSFVPGFGPRMEAEDVVKKHFGDGSAKLFKDADYGDSGIADLTTLANTKLVKLTDPETYTLGGYWYTPDVISNSVTSASACADFPVGTALCAIAYADYELQNIYYLLQSTDYKLGKFYDNDEGDEVRFAYFLKVSQAPVIFGKNFFYDIPEIIVVAAAKPYGGYLGDEFEDNFIGYGEQSGKEISATYKAKLVPVTNREVAALALRMASTEDPTRWLVVFH